MNRQSALGWFSAATIITALYLIGDNTTTKEEAKNAIKAPKTTVRTVQSDFSTSTSPMSPKDALAALTKETKPKSTPTVSDSRCGQFTFLVRSDGSHQFYKWDGKQWVPDGPKESVFSKNFMNVQMVDVTGDKVDDFLITLPTWDPLKIEPRPLSGAVFASIDCKWDWRTFRTTYGGSYYQLDNMFWDTTSKKIVAGDEVTNMDAANYDGNRKTKQRFFVFSAKFKEFVLSSGTPPRNPRKISTPTTEPLLRPSEDALKEAAFQCDTNLFDILDAYNITNLDPTRIGRTWFNNSDFKFRVGTTPKDISEPIVNACAIAARKRISQVTETAENSCLVASRKELAQAYGLPTSSSRNQIASAVAKDFLPRFRSLVMAACLRTMK